MITISASLRCGTHFFFRNPREGLTFLHEILARSNFAPKTPPETPFDEVDTLEIDWVLGLAQMDFLWGFLEREAKSPETPIGLMKLIGFGPDAKITIGNHQL